MDKVLLEIIQPTTTKINAEFDQLIIPGIDGENIIKKSDGSPFASF